MTIGGLQIFVKTLAGKTITMNLEPFDITEIVKEKIQDKIGSSVDQQQLMLLFGGMSLRDGRTLSSYKIYHGDNLDLVARVRG